jgi:hypothetical protein
MDGDEIEEDKGGKEVNLEEEGNRLEGEDVGGLLICWS